MDRCFEATHFADSCNRQADWHIHDWRGELIDRRMDYYHEGHEEHEGFHHKLHALRDLRGFKTSIDAANLVAALIVAGKDEYEYRDAE